MPDTLMKRVKLAAARRKTTFRALVVDALERTLDDSPKDFRLEDAAAGQSADVENRVDQTAINAAINAQREHRFAE